MLYPVIDCATNVTAKLPQLKTAGVTAIIRYDHRIAGSWKQIHPAEAKAIADHGLKLGIVYEGAGATPSAFSYNSGHADALYSRRMAPGRGQPENSVLYFAVDFDPSQQLVNGLVVPYFHGVHDALEGSGFFVGVYGSGLVCRILKEKGLVTCTWPTCSKGFTESRHYISSRAWHLWQAICEHSLFGLDCDLNEENAEVWGQFTPWGAAPPPPQPIPLRAPPNLYDTHWLQASLKTLGFDPGALDGILGPQTRAAIKAFQQSVLGLAADGIPGPLTVAAIKAALPQA